MALVRECDICGCEIAARTNGYYRCTKMSNKYYEFVSKNSEAIDICVNCFKEMVQFKGKEI